MVRALVIAGLLAVVGGCPKKRKIPVPPTAKSPAPMRWAEGTYGGDAEGGGAGTLHVHAVASALYVIWLGEERPRVWIFEEDPELATLRAASYVGIGDAPGHLKFTMKSATDTVVVFGGGSELMELLTVRRTDAGDLALLEAGTQTPFTASELKSIVVPPAVVLERADRAFAADSRALGGEAWAATAAPRAAIYFDDGDAIVGPVALKRVFTQALEAVDLRWEPVASGMSASGRFGYTVGKDVATVRDDKRSVRGSYVTIWEMQFDGTAKWIFHTGR